MDQSSTMRARVAAVLCVIAHVTYTSAACAEHPAGETSGAKQLARVAGDAKFGAASPPPDSGKAKSIGAEPEWLVSLAPGDALPSDVRIAVADGRWSDVVAALDKGDRKARPSFHSFLHGYAAWRSGDPKKALKVMRGVHDGVPALSDLAHWVSAEAALEAGNAHDAVLHAARVSVGSPRRARALLLLAKGLMASGARADKTRAVETLEALLKAHPSGGGAPEASLLLAGLYEERGDWDEAAKRYDRMITDVPLVDEIGVALERLKLAKPKASAKTQAYITQQTHPQYLSKLRALFARHRSEEVVTAGQRYLKSLEPASELACEAMFLVGRSLTKLRQHADSVAWYDRVIEECPESEWVLKAYYLGGKAYWNVDLDKKAIARFEKLVATFPKHSYADDAMLYIARIHRSAGNPRAARKVLERQVERYPGGDMLKDAHWLMVRDAVAKKDHDAVIAYVDKVKDPGEHDLYSRGRLAYFKARALEQKGRKKEARAVYAEVIGAHPLGYYALLSLHGVARIDGVKVERGGDLCAGKKAVALCPKAPSASGSKAPKVVLPKELAEDEQFAQGAWLLRMGLSLIHI